MAHAIARVRARWKELSPAAPFEFTFMDEKLQSMYRSELQLKKASGIATGLMILIILFGIFGVLALALTRRTKEIAVRKVLRCRNSPYRHTLYKAICRTSFNCQPDRMASYILFLQQVVGAICLQGKPAGEHVFCGRTFYRVHSFFTDYFAMHESCIIKSGKKSEDGIVSSLTLKPAKSIKRKALSHIKSSL